MNSPRILIVRLSALGDVVTTLPLACALKDRLPAAEIAWVVESPSAAVLRGHRAIDRLIEVPRRFLRSPLAVWRLRRELRSFAPHLAIDAQGLSKSAAVAWLSGAPRRVGPDKPWGREISRYLNNERIDIDRPHAVDRHLLLLGPLGIAPGAVRFDVPEGPADAAFADALVRVRGLSGGFAAMHVGAAWASKVWPAARFAAVAGHLSRARGLPVLALWGNLRERGWAEQVAAVSLGAAQVAPAMKLSELAAVLRRARIYIGGDTGPTHLAAAVGAPCVALHGPSPVEHGPYGAGHERLQALRFEGSSRQRRTASTKYIEAISVEMACAACDRMLERRGREAA